MYRCKMQNASMVDVLPVHSIYTATAQQKAEHNLTLERPKHQTDYFVFHLSPANERRFAGHSHIINACHLLCHPCTDTGNAFMI